MKKQLSIIAFLAFIFMSVHINGQVRSLDNFNHVDVSMGIKVNLIASNETKADINIQKGEYDDLITEVRNDKLTIKWKKKGWWSGSNNRKVSINLYYRAIDGIDVSSGSRVYNEDNLSSDDMDIDISSGASVELEITTGDLDVDISSGSSCTLRGSADDQTVDVSSGASYNGIKLATESTNVDVSSGASAKVWVTEKLVANASSGGSVQFKGDPKTTDIEAGKWSGGSIKKIGGSSDY